MERLDIIRYILIGGSIVAALFNLVDELNKDAGFGQIFFYSGTLIIIASILLFLENKWAVITVFYVSGFFMLIDYDTIGALSPAVLLFGYANHLSDNIYLKAITYVVVLVSTTAIYVFNSSTPEDLINILIAYSVLFAFNELVFKERQKDEIGG